MFQNRQYGSRRVIETAATLEEVTQALADHMRHRRDRLGEANVTLSEAGIALITLESLLKDANSKYHRASAEETAARMRKEAAAVEHDQLVEQIQTLRRAIGGC